MLGRRGPAACCWLACLLALPQLSKASLARFRLLASGLFWLFPFKDTDSKHGAETILGSAA